MSSDRRSHLQHAGSLAYAAADFRFVVQSFQKHTTLFPPEQKSMIVHPGATALTCSSNICDNPLVWNSCSCQSASCHSAVQPRWHSAHIGELSVITVCVDVRLVNVSLPFSLSRLLETSVADKSTQCSGCDRVVYRKVKALVEEHMQMGSSIVHISWT